MLSFVIYCILQDLGSFCDPFSCSLDLRNSSQKMSPYLMNSSFTSVLDIFIVIIRFPFVSADWFGVSWHFRISSSQQSSNNCDGRTSHNRLCLFEELFHEVISRNQAY